MRYLFSYLPFTHKFRGGAHFFGSSAEFVGEKTAKERRSIEPETRCGNDAPWKPWKSPKARAAFPPFPPRLEIPQKARDFHIPTATTAGSHSSKLPLDSSQQARASGGIRDLLVPCLAACATPRIEGQKKPSFSHLQSHRSRALSQAWRPASARIDPQILLRSQKMKELRGNVMCAPTARIASGWKSHPDSCR